MPVCPCGVRYPTFPSMLKPEHQDRAQAAAFPSQCSLALGLLFTHHMILEAVFSVQNQEARGAGPIHRLPRAGTYQPPSALPQPREGSV